MSSPTLRAILFDFDGTLVPNLDLGALRRRTRALTLNCGVPSEVIEGLYIVETVRAGGDWLRAEQPQLASKYDSAAHRLIDTFEMEAAARTRPFAGIPEAIRTLTRRHRLAIVTRNTGRAARVMFPGLDSCFDSVRCRDTAPAIKPDPAHLRAAMDDLEARPAHTAMVGDSRMDIETGRALGLMTIGVLTGHCSRSEFADAGADVVLDSVAALPAYLGCVS